jgi:hypothetical protein
MKFASFILPISLFNEDALIIKLARNVPFLLVREVMVFKRLAIAIETIFQHGAFIYPAYCQPAFS